MLLNKERMMNLSNNQGLSQMFSFHERIFAPLFLFQMLLFCILRPIYYNNNYWICVGWYHNNLGSFVKDHFFVGE
jgi:hypothetical protein